MSPLATGELPRVSVWDPLVRFTHWIVALGCLSNILLIGGHEPAHEYTGYIVLSCVSLRILWGFVGSKHARFADFVPGWASVRSYSVLMLARREPRYLGHNPAGALMIITLIALVVVCGLSGWMLELDRFFGNQTVETVHETSGNLILVAACLHVLGAVVESIRHRENLILSMVTGRKRVPQVSDVAH